MKKICANCHFFVRRYHGQGGAEHTFEVTAPNRLKAAQGNTSWQHDSESLACFKGIWDEGLGLNSTAKNAAISRENRRGRCYFLPYQPGMLLPAAEKLQQERASASSDKSKSRLAIYGLLLTIAGLVAKLAYGA
ncbi:hypothetical protein ACFWZU_16140 [Frateuria sp. GZRR33]|uniref:hypothetical protein n=1 Tax=Frateuria sp. GZRR33 TaxID=3351535 RepID=UPI003EDC8A7A